MRAASLAIKTGVAKAFQQKKIMSTVKQEKLSLLEEDDEFEEFPVEGKCVCFVFEYGIDWQDAAKMTLHQWDDNWEDDDQGADEFSVQLRREIEKRK